MTPLTLLLTDEMMAFATRQAAALKLSDVTDYLRLLLRQAQAIVAAAKFEVLMLEGLAEAPGLSPAAQADIDRHLIRYAAQPAIAARFQAALTAAMDGTLCEATDVRLTGLLACPLKGFADFVVYRLPGPRVLRVLHLRRDLLA